MVATLKKAKKYSSKNDIIITSKNSKKSINENVNLEKKETNKKRPLSFIYDTNNFFNLSITANNEIKKIIAKEIENVFSYHQKDGIVLLNDQKDDFLITRRFDYFKVMSSYNIIKDKSKLNTHPLLVIFDVEKNKYENIGYLEKHHFIGSVVPPDILKKDLSEKIINFTKNTDLTPIIKKLFIYYNLIYVILDESFCLNQGNRNDKKTQITFINDFVNVVQEVISYYKSYYNTKEKIKVNYKNINIFDKIKSNNGMMFCEQLYNGYIETLSKDLKIIKNRIEKYNNEIKSLAKEKEKIEKNLKNQEKSKNINIIEQHINEIKKLDKIVKNCYLTNNKIFVETEEIILSTSKNSWNLGEILISIPIQLPYLTIEQCINAISAIRLKTPDKIAHPHTNSRSRSSESLFHSICDNKNEKQKNIKISYFCFGNMYDILHKLYSNKDYFNICLSILSFLSTVYTSDSMGKRIHSKCFEWKSITKKATKKG